MSDYVGAIMHERSFLVWLLIALCMSVVAQILKRFADGGPELILGINVMNILMLVGWSALITALIVYVRDPDNLKERGVEE